MPNNNSNPNQYSQYDKILRENMRFTLPGIIQKVLKLDIVSTEELKDKIQITRQKEVDALRIVTDTAGNTYVLQVEFESGNKRKMNFRMAEYRSMLHQIYDHPVKQYVMYLGKNPLSTPNRIDLPGFKFEYGLIPFSELPYELFLSAEEPEEQLLTVLANFGNADPTLVIRSLLEKIGKNNPGGLTDNKYFEQLRVIIQLRNLDTQLNKAMDSVKTFFKEERDVLYRRGEIKGEARRNHDFVENLLSADRFTVAEVANFASVTEAFVKKVQKELEAKK